MEKYMANMRIILCANSTSKLIAPIKSRCLLIRVAAPNEKEVREKNLRGWVSLIKGGEQMALCLANVAKREKFDLPDSAAKEIIEDANGNVRKALLVLEALKMQS